MTMRSLIKITGTSSNPVRQTQIPVRGAELRLSDKLLANAGESGQTLALLPELRSPISVTWQGHNRWLIALKQHGDPTTIHAPNGSQLQMPHVTTQEGRWAISAQHIVGYDNYDFEAGAYHLVQGGQTFRLEFPHITEEAAERIRVADSAARDALALEQHGSLLQSDHNLGASADALYEGLRANIAANMAPPRSLLNFGRRRSQAVDPASLTRVQMQREMRTRLQPLGGSAANYVDDPIFLDAWHRLNAGIRLMDGWGNDGYGTTIVAPVDPSSGRVLQQFTARDWLNGNEVAGIMPITAAYPFIELHSNGGMNADESGWIHTYTLTLRDERSAALREQAPIDALAEDRLRGLSHILQVFSPGSMHVSSSFATSAE